MVVPNRGNDDRRANGSSSDPAPRWVPDSQGEETSAAEMLQSLQPVRDLAQNFDIDIATYLDEYLEKLVDVLHDNAGPSIYDARDVLGGVGGGMSWDFAQAALLVQNSSAVYCRKVDYFSSLVVKALEGFQHSIDEAGLSNARGGARGSSNRGGASGGATDEDRAFWGLLRDDNYDFLTLDDVMPVAKPSDITRGTAARRKNDRRASLGTLSMSFYTQQQSTLPSLSQQQMASVNQRASSSHLASSLLDHLDAGRTGALEDAPYRVPKYHALNLVGSKCEVTPKGALLLPGVAEASGRRRGGRGSVPVVVQATVDCETNGTPSHKSSPAGTAGHEPGGTENDADFPVASDDRYDDDDDGPGFDFGGHDDDDEVHDENQNAPPPQQQQKAGVLRTAQNVATQHKKSVTFNDPWELLDPHQPMGNHRPLKKGMTLVVPDGLYNLPSDCVTGARTKRRTGKENSKALGRASQSSSEKGSPNGPLSESYATDMYRNLTEGTDLPQMSLTDMAFGEEFAYIRKQNRRIQMAEKRKARQSARGAADVDAWDGPHDAVEDDRDADFGGFDDGIDDDDYDDYERDDSGGGGGIVWGDDEGPNTGNAGLASVEDAFHGDDDGGLTFEELCRARIQEFAKGAEKYANETQLLQRVRKWQEKLRPLLEEEEQRQVFDIHVYGQAILDSIQTELATRNEEGDESVDGQLSAAVPFEAVARDRPKHDVPRLFLAALSLCNAGNVRIDQDLNLQLLSPVMEHPMETFLAPSVRETQ